MSGRMSAKTGRAPRSTTAFAVDTKVNDGMMTSSPGPRSRRRAASSSAVVQEVVSRTRRAPSSSSSRRRHFSVNTPSPEIRPESTDSWM